MAIALVGSVGTAVTGTTSVSPTFGQSTTAGNLLIAWVINDNGVTPATPSGWTLMAGNGAGDRARVYFKPNCGAGETAPTFSEAGATFMAAALAEFSGADTASPEDGGNRGNTSNAGTSSPLVINKPSADSASGNLIVT